MVPFSNDDMDTYDNSFNDENIVAFNKVVPVKHLVKMREKKKSFDGEIELYVCMYLC